MQKISLEELSFSFPDGITVFHNFFWEIYQGDAWSVLGPSGCGKTTLLYLLAGLIKPTSGKILFDQVSLARPRPQTGMILQDYGLLPWATIRENAVLGQKIRKFYGPDGKHSPENYVPSEEIDNWLERLEILTVQDQYPNQVSGGQRQCTAIARTLSLKPALLLMDEPFSSLDALTRQNLQDLIIRLWKEESLTLVIVTHSIEEAAVLGQKILLLKMPPNHQTIIFENQLSIEKNYRESRAYGRMIRQLRQELENK